LAKAVDEVLSSVSEKQRTSATAASSQVMIC
jgi:hypothetical protein